MSQFGFVRVSVSLASPFVKNAARFHYWLFIIFFFLELRVDIFPYIFMHLCCNDFLFRLPISVLINYCSSDFIELLYSCFCEYFNFEPFYALLVSKFKLQETFSVLRTNRFYFIWWPFYLF